MKTDPRKKEIEFKEYLFPILYLYSLLFTYRLMPKKNDNKN